MALTASRSPTGFELLRYTEQNEIIRWPGDPGVTFERGHMVYLTGGVLAECGDSTANPVGIVAKTTVCPAATTYFPVPGPDAGIYGPSDLDGSYADTLIPIYPLIPAGIPIVRGTIAGQQDEAVAGVSASTRSIGLTTGLGTDDYGIGAIIFIYDGPGKGQFNIVEDYDHADGNVALEIITHRTWGPVYPTTSSSVIILTGKNAASDGRSILNLGRMDLASVSTFDIDDGYNDGDFCIYEDFMQVAQSLFSGIYQLTVPAIRAVEVL